VSPEEEALRRLLEILNRNQIPYMLTGSVATSYHGRPRSTHDAEVVIDPELHQIEGLVRELEAAGFYVNTEGAILAVKERRQFNVIDTKAACKIDLIVRKDRPYSRLEFDRRQFVDLSFERQIAIVAPEDAILSKLEWARKSGDSERQLRDAAGVLELNTSLDREYITRWAAELGVSDFWERISKSAH
jgi:hypothetical protein